MCKFICCSDYRIVFHVVTLFTTKTNNRMCKRRKWHGGNVSSRIAQASNPAAKATSTKKKEEESARNYFIMEILG